MWSIEAREDRILVRPGGHLEVGESTAAAAELETKLGSFSGSCVLIIDLTLLRGYDSDVRRLWQDTIKRHRDRFRSMLWVSDTPMFRMVAASVSLFTGIPGRVIGSDEDPLSLAV